MAEKLRWWAAVVVMVLATLATIWVAGFIGLEAMTSTENPRWPIYIMMALVLSMLWSGAALIRKRTNQGIFVFILSVAFGLPLILLVVAFSFGD